MTPVRLNSGQYILKWPCYFVNTMPRHQNLRMLQTGQKKYLLRHFIAWIDVYSIYLSTGFYFIRFGIGTDINFLIFFELIMFFTFFESREMPEARICEPAVAFLVTLVLSSISSQPSNVLFSWWPGVEVLMFFTFFGFFWVPETQNTKTTLSWWALPSTLHKRWLRTPKI